MSSSTAEPGPLDARTRWLWLLLPLAGLLLNLGGIPLFDVDEGAFSEATREMFARNDFLSTWLNGSPRFDKPILIYWCQAIFVWLLGPNEWAFRLPSAIAGAFWCQAVARFAFEQAGRRAAWFALAIAGTSLGVQIIGRAAIADALLNMLLALALFDAWRHLASGARRPLYWSFLWIGLGLLTKGPIAILIPGATTLLYCAMAGRWRDWLRASFNPLGCLILLAVALPWYLVALSIHGQAFIDGFFLKHNLERFSGPLEGHSGSATYYLYVIPLLLLPWLSWLIVSLRQLWGDWQQGPRRFLWLWCLFVTVFFSFSGTKLPHYALYGCTPLFVLMALHAEQIRLRWLGALPLLCLLALMLALPALLQMALDKNWIKDAYYQLQFARLAELPLRSYFMVMAASLAAALAVLVVWRADAARAVSLAALVIIPAFALALMPLLGELLQGPVKRSGLAAREMQGADMVLWNFHAPSFSVYRQQETPPSQPVAGQIALTRADRLPPDVPVDILRREGGVLLVRLRQP